MNAKIYTAKLIITGPLVHEKVTYSKYGVLIKRHYVIGLVSFGRGCAHPDHPGFYAKVSGALDWINNVTSKSNRAVDTTTKTDKDRFNPTEPTFKGVNIFLYMNLSKQSE